LYRVDGPNARDPLRVFDHDGQPIPGPCTGDPSASFPEHSPTQHLVVINASKKGTSPQRSAQPQRHGNEAPSTVQSRQAGPNPPAAAGSDSTAGQIVATNSLTPQSTPAPTIESRAGACAAV